MSKRAWTSLIAVVTVVIIGVVIGFVIANNSDAEPDVTPSPSSTPLPTVTVTTAPEPTPSLTPGDGLVPTTCDTTSTTEFQTISAGNGWISWETQDQQIGARPFDAFPNGTPEEAIVCRWGADPNLATDNVIDLAWSLIDPESAVAAMTKLEEQGFVRLEAPEGVYLTVQAEAGSGDADGWGSTYLFGFDDVRWAATKADVKNYVKAPAEAD